MAKSDPWKDIKTIGSIADKCEDRASRVESVGKQMRRSIDDIMCYVNENGIDLKSSRWQETIDEHAAWANRSDEEAKNLREMSKALQEPGLSLYTELYNMHNKNEALETKNSDLEQNLATIKELQNLQGDARFDALLAENVALRKKLDEWKQYSSKLETELPFNRWYLKRTKPQDCVTKPQD
jgi:hypothetical protein